MQFEHDIGSMIYEHKSIKEILRYELQERLKANPRYSMRSFARSLNIHAAELSLVLRGERSLSYKSSQKVIKNLNLSPGQQKYFIELLQFEKNGLNLLEADPTPIEKNQNKLSPERFQKISKWYHFAILNLMTSQDFIWSPAHIAKRLSISQVEAGFAMQDLCAAGLVKIETSSKSRTKNMSAKVVVVKTEIPSSVIKNYHKEILEKAQMALHEIPMEFREYQSIGLNCNLSDLPKIKKAIDQFTEELIEKCHRHRGEEVYQLQISLFPLTALKKDLPK